MILKIIFAIIILLVLAVLAWAFIREIKKRKKPSVTPEIPLPAQPVKTKIFAARDCEVKNFKIIEVKKDPEFMSMAHDPVIILRDNCALSDRNRRDVSGHISYYSNVCYLFAGYNGNFARPPKGFKKSYSLYPQPHYKYVKA